MPHCATHYRCKFGSCSGLTFIRTIRLKHPRVLRVQQSVMPRVWISKGVFLWLLSKQQQIPTARTPVTGPAPGLCPCIQGTDVPPELVSQSSGLCLLPPVGLGSNRGTHPHRGAGQTRNPCSRCSASTSACQGLSRGDPE